MIARTVVCPGCRVGLKLKTAMPAGVTSATCPQCGATVPLAPASDDSTGRGVTLPGPPGAPSPNEFTFLAPPLQPGDLGSLGPYRVLGVLRRGGMGVVFRAEDPQLQRPVALKVMLPQTTPNPTDRARFVREARAQAKIEHDHVATIFHVGEDRGAAFLAMPLLRGTSLSDALKANAQVPLPSAVRIAREVAAGLSAAHDKGLIHRDIKPGNVWLEGQRLRVKILDFGLARPATDGGTAATEITRLGAIVGTPAYMSPEQAKGAALDHRSDLFSLGVLLYQMITGKQPFRGPNATVVLIAVATENPPAPAELNPEVPAALSALTMELLAKRPDDRPPTAEAVAERLRAIEANLSTPGPVVVALPVPGKPSDPWTDLGATEIEPGSAELTVVEAPRARPARTGRAFAVGGAVFVAVILAAAIYFTRPPDRGAKVTPPTEPTLKKETKDETKSKLPVLPSDPNRRAAEYVFSVGGNAHVNDGGEIRRRELLPAEPFQLTAVSLDACALTPEGLSAFKGCTDLKKVVFHYSNVDDAGLAHFADCPELTLLDLNDTKGAATPTGGSKVTDVGVANFKRCKKLLTLNLYAADIGDAGVAHFQGCDKLQQLHLGRTRVTDAGLANFRTCTELTHLWLHTSGIGNAGLEHFKGCKRLEGLDLGDTKVTDAGLAHFRDCKTFTELKLAKTAITDEGLAHFAGNDRLFHLLLNECAGVTDVGLANFKNCKALTHLLLDDTKTTDAGVAYFRGCKELKYLSLRGTQITNVAVEDIKHFDALTYLNLERTKVTESGVERLHKALPKCTIDWNGERKGPNPP